MPISSTVSFTVCFMVWMMLAVVGIPVKEELGLTETQFSILAALPVLSGSLIRVPLGIWTDKYGGRIVMFVLMMVSVPAIFLMGYAYAYWHFLLIGLMMGLAGGTFSVGTPYVARWFPKEQQGLAMWAMTCTAPPSSSCASAGGTCDKNSSSAGRKSGSSSSPNSKPYLRYSSNKSTMALPRSRSSP